MSQGEERRSGGSYSEQHSIFSNHDLVSIICPNHLLSFPSLSLYIICTQTMMHQQLIMEVVSQLNRTFTPDPKLIKKRIEDLIDR